MKPDEEEVWRVARVLLARFANEPELDVQRLADALDRELTEIGHRDRLHGEGASYGGPAFYTHVVTTLATEDLYEVTIEGGRPTLRWRKKP